MSQEVLIRGRNRRRLRAAPALARVVRARSGLTQSEIADLLGVDRSAVSRWEAGRRMPRAAMLARYADLLDRLSLSESEG